MRTLSTSFVLGYHGCDRKAAAKFLAGTDFRHSRNEYDWLGPGVYFWEANPRRGLEFAQELKKLARGNVTHPAVVGAVIDLGLCLDLTTAAGIDQVKQAHRALLEIARRGGLPLPANSRDMLRRNLDCAVFQTLHRIRRDRGDPPIDTIRGVFVEGAPLYQGAGIYAKTHIQICVRNGANIKGVFRVKRRFLGAV